MNWVFRFMWNWLDSLPGPIRRRVVFKALNYWGRHENFVWCRVSTPTGWHQTVWAGDRTRRLHTKDGLIEVGSDSIRLEPGESCRIEIATTIGMFRTTYKWDPAPPAGGFESEDV